MSEIKVFDNFLDQDLFDNIEKIMTSDHFPWYFNEGVNVHNDGFFQFTHTFYNLEKQINSEIFYDFEPIIKKINPSFLIRIKANLLTIDKNNVEHGYHVDVTREDATTAILYINTNNGYTIFENKEKIMSVKNRFVEFPSYLKHSGSTCTDENARILLNFNYVK